MKPCDICANKNIWCGTCKVNSFGGCSWNFEPIQQQPAVRKLTEKEFIKFANDAEIYEDTFDMKRLRYSANINNLLEPEPVKTALQQAREKFLSVYQGRGMADGELEAIKDLYEKAIEELKGGK